MLSYNQSPFAIPQHDGYLLYPPNPMQHTAASIANNGQQLSFVRYNGYADSMPVNCFEDQASFEYPPLQSRPPNLAAFTPTGPSVYQPATGPNGLIVNTSAGHFYPDQGLVMSNPAMQCAPISNAYSSLSPVSASQNCYYSNALVPYMNGGPTSNYISNGNLAVGNALLNQPSVHFQGVLEKREIYARQWTGELHEITENVTDYQCRFELETDKFRMVIEDLRKLFRSKITILDDIPPNGPPHLLFVYFKSCDFSEVMDRCCISRKSGEQEFVHPEKQYRVPVVVKALNLATGLHYGRPLKGSRGQQECQLYVDGLCRMFSAHDLAKIYDDLYKNVQSVRVFNDRNGYPNKSALVQFRKVDSYRKALQETPIMVKTSTMTVFLRNKIYERSNKQYLPKQFNNSNLGAKAFEPVTRMPHYSTIRCDLNGNLVGTTKQHSSNPIPVTKRFQLESDKEATRVRQVRKDALKQNCGQYTRIRKDLTVYNKLKYLNYLSD